MNLTIDADDLAPLSPAQKEALLQALFLAVGIDRLVDAEESQRFNQEVARIPWGIDPEPLRRVLHSAAARRKVSQAAENIAWVAEIAAQLPDQALREKTLATMGRIALANELNDAERGLLGAVAQAFEIPPERLLLLREALLPAGPSSSSSA